MLDAIGSGGSGRASSSRTARWPWVMQAVAKAVAKAELSCAASCGHSIIKHFAADNHFRATDSAGVVVVAAESNSLLSMAVSLRRF